jgi:hypothetical protein
MPSSTSSCDGPQEIREATLEEIKAFIRSTRKAVLTFAGYSGAEYEDPEAMLAHSSRILVGRNPADTMINAGGTAAGIGAVYSLAKQLGFATMGIVSSLARDEGAELARCADHIFYVKDSSWGGRLAGTDRLSPTSAAMVECTTIFVAIGGGDVARDEILAARQAGKSVEFIPADMSHKIACAHAEKKGQPAPTDFRGSAHSASI